MGQFQLGSLAMRITLRWRMSKLCQNSMALCQWSEMMTMDETEESYSMGSRHQREGKEQGHCMSKSSAYKAHPVWMHMFPDLPLKTGDRKARWQDCSVQPGTSDLWFSQPPARKTWRKSSQESKTHQVWHGEFTRNMTWDLKRSIGSMTND